MCTVRVQYIKIKVRINDKLFTVHVHVYTYDVYCIFIQLDRTTAHVRSRNPLYPTTPACTAVNVHHNTTTICIFRIKITTSL